MKYVLAGHDDGICYFYIATFFKKNNFGYEKFEKNILNFGPFLELVRGGTYPESHLRVSEHVSSITY